MKQNSGVNICCFYYTTTTTTTTTNDNNDDANHNNDINDNTNDHNTHAEARMKQDGGVLKTGAGFSAPIKMGKQARPRSAATTSVFRSTS